MRANKIILKAKFERLYDLNEIGIKNPMMRWYIEDNYWTKDFKPGNVIQEKNIDEWVLVDEDYMLSIPVSINIEDPRVLHDVDNIVERLLK